VKRLALWGLLIATAAPVPLCAQARFHWAVGAGVGATRVRTVTGGSPELWTGVTLGGDGRLGSGRVGLEAGYRQGTLSPDTGAGATQDLAEGRLQLSVRALPWLEILAGPRARAFITPGGTERWLFGEGRVRIDAPLAVPALRTHAEVWAGLSSSLNLATEAPSYRGGAVGVTYQLPRSPVWLRLTYALDRSESRQLGIVETVETLGVSAGIGRH